MAQLYTNPKGRPVTAHSYSSGTTFSTCPRKYQLQKVKGWREKRRGASLDFGICVETAIQRFHFNGLVPGDGVTEFRRLWHDFEEREDLNYTAKEGSWKDMFQMGSEMLALYEIKLPSFGYVDPKFQLNYRKVPFPGSELGDLEFTAYIDLLADFGPLPGSHENQFEPIIIDIKTGSSSLDESNPAKLMLNPQLRTYAWVTGVPLVGFLWFTKARPEGYKRGDRVTLLVNKAHMKAGDPGVVLSTTEESDEVQAGAVLTPKQYEEYEERAKGLRGKALEAVKTEFGHHYATGVHLDELTRQRVQFVYTRIPEQEILETGESIGMEMVNICSTNEAGVWPQRPGTQWPNNWCDLCQFLPICTHDEKAINETLVQITDAGIPPLPENWIDEMEG